MLEQVANQYALLMEKQMEEVPMPSPGRESGVLNAELKRVASANIAPEKKQKILRKNEMRCDEIEDISQRQDELVFSHLLNMYNIVIGNEEDVLLFYEEKLSIK